MAIHIRGRNRILNEQMKVKLCDMVAESSTIEQAAEALDVSVRTVQRERKDDEDFDHELRLALQAAPDPKKLMESAARTHWRAAAWLLERTDPEHYARRPASSASPQQVEFALRFVLEAALKAATPEREQETYDQVRVACEHAFTCLFPNIGPWGHAKNPKLPPTPLADGHQHRRLMEYSRANVIPDRDEAGNILPPPAPTRAEEVVDDQAQAERGVRHTEQVRQEQEREAHANAGGSDAKDRAADDRAGILSPKIAFATKLPPRSQTLCGNSPPDAPRRDLAGRLNRLQRQLLQERQFAPSQAEAGKEHSPPRWFPVSVPSPSSQERQTADSA